MKKNMYHLLQWRILKATKSRFLSILLIIFIGTAFFAGLRITPLVMNTATTKYLEQQNFADITYISSYGVTEAEMEKMELIDGVKSVQGSYHFDALSKINNHQEAVVVYSFDENSNNQPYLLDGRLPKTNSECIVDARYAKQYPDVKIGSKIQLQTANLTKEFSVVGLSKDARHLLYYDRGANTYGDGSSAGFIHLPKEAAQELSYDNQLQELIGEDLIYQEVLITIDKEAIPLIFSNDYEKMVTTIKADIEEVITPMINERFNQIINDKYALLDPLITTYEDGLTTYNENPETSEIVSSEIEMAKNEITAIPKPIIILLDYEVNQGLASFKSDSDRIDALSKVFPTIFFLVAALVSLTTMTRMVEEQRAQNGALRALGYHKKDIIFQYLLYALLATFIGTVIGIAFGIYIFPKIIYGLYSSMMYDIPQKMILCFDAILFLQTAGIAIITIIVATFFACAKELNVVPAILMRAKAPKIGKRIILEKIPWLWKKISFNQKVTFRNIFRYKKRFFMSIIGIAGCSALLITGFGIKYSITDMANRQFEDIQIYDASVTFKTPINSNDIDSPLVTLNADNSLIKEQMLAHHSTIEVKQNAITLDSTFIVPEATHQIQQYFGLYAYESGAKIDLSDSGVTISKKAAEVLKVGVGDTIHITSTGKEFDVSIATICQNYLQHYIYMSPTLYESLTGELVIYNMSYLNMKQPTKEKEQTLGNQLMDNENINSVVFNSTITNNFMTQMSSIDLVVWVLIISAGFLAFIVLYNLTNINIKERTNEIATIKVLGFYRHEIYDYIFRENKVLTIVGALVGCLLGSILHQFILQTVETDFIMFVRTIRPISFIYAFILTYLFTIIINFIMRSLLKRIDMIASLKQVE